MTYKGWYVSEKKKRKEKKNQIDLIKYYIQFNFVSVSLFNDISTFTGDLIP